MPVRKQQHVLAPQPQAVRVARGMLSTSLAAWGLSAWEGDAAVIVSSW